MWNGDSEGIDRDLPVASTPFERLRWATRDCDVGSFHRDQLGRLVGGMNVKLARSGPWIDDGDNLAWSMILLRRTMRWVLKGLGNIRR
jgi:hypothetical protein